MSLREFYYSSPIGTLQIRSLDGAITRVYLENNTSPSSGTPDCPVIAECIRQLQEYFAGERRVFHLPINTSGTEFQEKVWAALKDIPYGQVCAYGDIARAIGNEKACRAVGGANNKNPILIITPCHRVIGANGALVGFGAGLDVKSFLLQLEAKSVANE